MVGDENMIVPTILIFQTDVFSWGQIVGYGPTVILLALILWFLLRMAPMWKEVKLKELDIRTEENKVKSEEAAALNALASVLKDIAVEQRRATESIEISQRVNADSAEKISQSVSLLARRVDGLETLEPRVRVIEDRLKTVLPSSEAVAKA
jgi:hypothetical protein